MLVGLAVGVTLAGLGFGLLMVPATAWLSVPLGVASVAIGLWSGPRLLALHSRLARSVLAPAPSLPGQPAPA